uniref:hypothetical protein n=1 Tax=Candidatus Collinsella stercoripullorum TaxID=2838522 RepID=UPI0022DF46CD
PVRPPAVAGPGASPFARPDEADETAFPDASAPPVDASATADPRPPAFGYNLKMRPHMRR